MDNKWLKAKIEGQPIFKPSSSVDDVYAGKFRVVIRYFESKRNSVSLIT